MDTYSISAISKPMDTPKINNGREKNVEKNEKNDEKTHPYSQQEKKSKCGILQRERLI